MALAWWARTGNVRRVFWLSLGVFVAGEGVVEFFGILLGGFAGQHSLNRTLLTAVLGGSTVLAGAALYRRGWLRRYAQATAAAAALATLPLIAVVWVSGHGAWDHLQWSGVVAIVGVLAASAQRLWLGDWTGAPPKQGVFAVSAAAIAAMVPLAIVSIWGVSSGQSDRAMWACSLLAFVALLLTPISKRALRKRET